jgi:hypothetical protein
MTPALLALGRRAVACPGWKLIAALEAAPRRT